MKLSPPKRPRWKPYALLTPGHKSLRVRTPTSDVTYVEYRTILAALSKLTKYVVFTPGKLREFIAVTTPSEWVMTTWRGRPVSMEHKPSGVKITSLRNALNDAPDDMLALETTMKWLEDYGVAPGSTSSMGWNLLRASLHEDVNISFDPTISEAAFFGPRQQVWQPDEYSNMVNVDQKAAYPFAMASEPMALGLRPVSPSTILTNEPGLVAAEVFVPFDLPYAPLPVRVGPRSIEFQYHEIKGIWTWRELRAAKGLGCMVSVQKCWAPRRTYDLFGPWWEMGKTGRNLPPGACDLAKLVLNGTWGQFAMRGEVKHERHFTGYGDFDYVERYVEPRTLPHVFAKHIACEVASRVRVKTLTEGLYGPSGMVVHVDTDGFICHRDSALPANSGDDFGQWRVKEEMQVVEIRAPQLYRYRTGRDDPAWHYVAAGMSRDGAHKEFKKRARTRTKIAYLSEHDVVIPSLKSHDRIGRYELLEEAERLVS